MLIGVTEMVVEVVVVVEQPHSSEMTFTSRAQIQHHTPMARCLRNQAAIGTIR
jgi:hypothetical protein